MHKIFFWFLFITLVACTTEGNGNSPDFHRMKSLDSAAELNVALGLAYLEAHKPALAQEKLWLAEKESPNNARVWLALAYFYQNTGRDGLAAIYYQKALAAFPCDPEVLNNYGAFLCQQGHYHQAMQYLTQAEHQLTYLSMDTVEENAGLCAYLNQQPTLAKKYLHKALAMNPNSSVAIQILAQLRSSD